MILLWGVPGDPPLAAVERILSRDGLNYVFLDQRAVFDTEMRLDVGGGGTSGTLSVQGEGLSLADISAAYPRPYPLEQIISSGNADASSAALQRAIMFHQLFSIWLDLTAARVVNRPAQMSLNASKPYQGLLIEAAGFLTPETLLTTDPDAARAFRDAHGGTIYKSISAQRSIVAQLNPADDARLDGVVWCPTQFQERISGRELRVHVVGEEVFGSEIDTSADDYRYASVTGAAVDIRAVELDDALADRCRRLAAAMGYLLAGIDLRWQNGDWYCFEVNPSPGFSYYQERTGQPIDEAVARLLRKDNPGQR